MNTCQYDLQQRRVHTNMAAQLLGQPDALIAQTLGKLAQRDDCAALGIQHALDEMRYSMLQG